MGFSNVRQNNMLDIAVYRFLFVGRDLKTSKIRLIQIVAENEENALDTFLYHYRYSLENLGLFSMAINSMLSYDELDLLYHTITTDELLNQDYLFYKIEQRQTDNPPIVYSEIENSMPDGWHTDHFLFDVTDAGKRIKLWCKPGDKVSWKRNGIGGSIICTIESFLQNKVRIRKDDGKFFTVPKRRVYLIK